MDVMEKTASEKRLIDANALKSYMDECSKETRFRVYYGYATSFIDASPTVDAVEVVRCKDCKHAWIHPCGYVYCHRDGRNAYEMTFNIDSFCSYGERKEGDDND